MAMRGFSRYGVGMLILVDGYNVIAPVAPPASSRAPASSWSDDWLHQERLLLLSRLADHLPGDLASRTCVVFDAAGQGRPTDPALHAADPRRPSRLRWRQIDVRFAVGYPEADDLIEELIRLHHSPKRLTVISSDHRLQAAARRRGAVPFDSAPWLDQLLEGTPPLAIRWPPKRPANQPPGHLNDSATQRRDEQTLQEWLQAFGLPADESDPPLTPQPPNDAKPAAATPKPPAQSRPATESGPGNPRRQLGQSNLFPEGYGDDLL